MKVKLGALLAAGLALSVAAPALAQDMGGQGTMTGQGMMMSDPSMNQGGMQGQGMMTGQGGMGTAPGQPMMMGQGTMGTGMPAQQPMMMGPGSGGGMAPPMMPGAAGGITGGEFPRGGTAQGAAGTFQPVSDEVFATNLLNQLSAMGFAQYRSFRRVGEVYVVEAVTPDFQVVVLEIDAATGQVRQTQ